MATKNTPAPAAPKPHKCLCSCGKTITTKGRFLPGHDARFASNLRKAVAAGTMTTADAQAKADEISDRFGAKVRRSLELVAQEQAKADEPKPEPAPAKAKAPAKPKQHGMPKPAQRTAAEVAAQQAAAKAAKPAAKGEAA